MPIMPITPALAKFWAKCILHEKSTWRSRQALAAYVEAMKRFASGDSTLWPSLWDLGVLTLLYAGILQGPSIELARYDPVSAFTRKRVLNHF